MNDDRIVVPPDAFIRSTGQVWKLVVGGVVLPFTVAGVALWRLKSAFDGPASALVIWLGIALTGVGLIVLILASVSCPRCKRRLLRRVVSDPDGSGAIAKFLARRDCPACGYVPGATG